MTANHYQTLNVAETATQHQIKQAYRRLAKELHPDRQGVRSGHEQIAQLNAAYEVLGDPHRRSHYDREQQLQRVGFESAQTLNQRAERTEHSQAAYRRRRQATQASEDAIAQWLRQVYSPVDRLMAQILSPLKGQLRALSGDPFDDDLMGNFQTYLGDSQATLEKALGRFQSVPSPTNAAGVAANLYHCLGQIQDGLEEMERYTYCYEESYLHTGQELFRIAAQLRRQASSQVKTLQ